jgi:hypothetical protein
VQTNHVLEDAVQADHLLWHGYDAGGPTLCLKVRYRDDEEVHDWQDGPGLVDALEQAAADGWRAFDREPGNAPGEYAIYHLVRTQGAPSHC